jgi:hypothetical protein
VPVIGIGRAPLSTLIRVYIRDIDDGCWAVRRGVYWLRPILQTA